MRRSVCSALALVIGLQAAGCGLIYHPSSTPSISSATGESNAPYAWEVIDITFETASLANTAWRYTPRSLPRPLTGVKMGALPGAAHTYAAATAIEAGTADAYTISAQTSLRQEARPDYVYSAPAVRTGGLYAIGAGDLVSVSAQPRVLTAASVQAARGSDPRGEAVQRDGTVFLEAINAPVRIGGLTVPEARAAIEAELARLGLIDYIVKVNVVGFNSQKAIVAGSAIPATTVPIALQPTTLRQVVLAASGGVTLDDDAVVRLIRGGQTYYMPFRNVVEGDKTYEIELLDQDYVYVIDRVGAQVEEARRRTPLDSSILANRSQSVTETTSGENLQIAKQNAALNERRFQFERENAQRSAELTQEQIELTRQNAELARANDERARQQLELARQAEIRAQAQLDLARTADERAQAQLDLARTADRRADSQFDLSRAADARAQSQLDLARSADERAAIAERERLGALGRDFIYIGGEVKQPTRAPLPFEQTLNLADAIFEARGLNALEGDPTGIHVVRLGEEGGKPKVFIYRLDASNIGNYAVATRFEMRPNDVMYVTAQPVTNWARVVGQITSSFSIFSTSAAGVNALK